MSTPSDCRFCGTPLTDSFADLGMSPLANRYLREDEISKMEPFYPLHAFVCKACFLVQLEQFEEPDSIFSDYAYFSSYSTSWLEHCERYADMVVERFDLTSGSKVVELASNDGYLLKYFAKKKIPVLGVEPAANVAEVAIAHGVPTVVEFFGVATAHKLAQQGTADLLIGNNVLAHVPDLNDFVEGMKHLLAPRGVLTMEFPHLLCLIRDRQFDTLYHEHFSYFSFHVVREVFAAHGLTLFDVDQIPTHGGSLRIYGCHQDDDTKPVSDSVGRLENAEANAGLLDLSSYVAFAGRVREEKREIVRSLIDLKEQGDRIVGYGAPAKGNTLLNYCGVGTDFLDFTVDANPHKQGMYLPGSHIPIRPPAAIEEAKPDIVFILPWNLRDEIIAQFGFVSDWGGRFLVRSPELRLLHPATL